MKAFGTRHGSSGSAQLSSAAVGARFDSAYRAKIDAPPPAWKTAPTAGLKRANACAPSSDVPRRSMMSMFARL